MRFTRVLAALAACCSWTAAQAWEPAEGTLSLDTPSLSATGGPYAGVNPTPAAEPVCAPGLCDTYTLTVDLPDNYKTANPNQVVRIQTKGFAGDDLDVYVYDDATNELIGSSASDGAEESVDVRLADVPAVVRVDVIVFLGTGSTGTLEINLAGAPGSGGGGGGGGGEDPCVATGTANAGAALLDLDVRRDFTQLAAGAAYGAFVRFNQGTNKQQDAILKRHGLSMKGDFRKYVNSVFVQGPVAAFNALSREPSVGRIEYNTPIRYLDATGPWATRARVAQEPVSGGPLLDAADQPINGKGQLLGVIDSGMFGAHPDFAGQTFHNFKLINFALEGVPQYIDVGEADSENAAGGHGTHVTGTVMGNGSASNGGYPVPLVAPNVPGTFTGVAPAADMIHWAHGAGLFVLSAVTAYEHMLDNLETFEAEYGSPLRAVNNSYGSDPAPYQPGATSSCLIKDIVERGVVMVFAASNEGGDGSTDQTSPTCKDPTPGVICVASYNDRGTGDRNGPLSTFSSRGKQGPTDADAINYPDISAPGDLITSTCSQATVTQAICTGGDDSAAETEWQPLYGTISGTSMAAPHVTGIIGLMTQMKPDLTPGEIEILMQKHAIKVGDGYQNDPQNPGGTIHFAYGAGLVDVPAILKELGAKESPLPPMGAEWTVLEGDTDALVAALASDATKLTMQDETFNGSTGVRFRLTVADASDVLSDLAYTVQMNVAGNAYATTVLYDGTAVTPAEPGAGNTAVATDAGIDGNTLSFFVPYSSLGFPAVKEPVHNVRVIVSDSTGEVDYAPSPADVPVLIQSVQPMYGRAFTVQLPAGLAPPSNEQSCVAPGLTVVTSPSGLTGNGAGLPAEDLRQMWFAEPEDMPGKLVITLKTAGLAQVPPGYRWYAYFKVPGSDAEYFAAMDSANGPVPRFIHGTRSAIDTPAAALGSFAVAGTLDAASNFNADGTITLVIDKASFPTPITDGMELTGIAGSIRQTTNPQNGVGLTVDSAGSIGGYKAVGNVCGVTPTNPGGPVVVPPVMLDPVPSTARSAAGRFGGGALTLALLLPLALLGLRRRSR